MRYLLIALLLVGCGARKVEKTKEETTVKTETTITDNTIEEYNSETEEVTITPIDTSRVFYVNNKPYKNVVLRLKKTKDNKIVVKDIRVSQIEDKHVIKEVKQVERKQRHTCWIFFLFVIALYLLYKYYKPLS
jgi:uncharacterized protein YcfL